MIIGLTGGVSSGKSTVARLFKKKGALVLDADIIAHKLISPGKSAYRKIVRYFGPQILNRNKTINRRVLGRIVFGTSLKLKKLNSFVHPEVIKAIKRDVRKWKDKRVVVIDAPLLIEAGLNRYVDRLIVVRCARSTQLKRLLRNGRSPEEARSMIFSQMPQSSKVKLADEVINGELGLEELRKKVKQIWEKFHAA